MSTGSRSESVDAVVIGAGPNGLAAAITLARAGHSVTVFEGAGTVGGGTRTAELTRPGFLHDVCSAVHPLAAGSPFFQTVPLAELGCELIHPDLALAHPVDGGRAGILDRSLSTTVEAAGADGAAWAGLFGPLVRNWSKVDRQVLGPIVRVPHHPVAMARFGLHALQPASMLVRRFHTDEVRGLFAGISAHGFLPLNRPLTSSFALMLGGLGHVYGWPVVRGGSQRLADALVAELESLGGRVVCDHPVRSLDELPPHRVVVADVTPRQLLELAGDRVDAAGRRRLRRFRYGPGVCKVDYALSEPVPWAADACRRAGTVHVGGTFEQVAAAEADVGRGRHPERPFVLAAQQSLFDDTRAPDGQHTLWTYTHVPNGSTLDVSERITAQIERFAPGFRDTVLDTHVTTADAYERYNPTFVGGDISGGWHGGTQLVFRPWPTLHPYRTPVDGVFLCSASTPPGGGVHGMCGANAAADALSWLDR